MQAIPLEALDAHRTIERLAFQHCSETMLPCFAFHVQAVDDKSNMLTTTTLSMECFEILLFWKCFEMFCFSTIWQIETYCNRNPSMFYEFRKGALQQGTAKVHSHTNVCLCTMPTMKGSTHCLMLSYAPAPNSLAKHVSEILAFAKPVLAEHHLI